ncbi:sensor histidine kinase [Allonocardiopsis opalescens]|uniref:histidine kinase n=1 Tax=Allonocardiopsis opalescens TaxID=1144618 RepID=A0A2T0PZ52_9ACTN|nr:sensor histidine kinase [Allonocardiopsis opalescens]PRX96687.1 signal transduction histidine kinase [Allonocardiopsis opalescens]
MLALLRSVWDEPRPAHPPPPGWRDWALVGVFAPLAVLEGVLRPELPWRFVTVAIVVGLVAVLPWRRSRPLAVLGICFTATTLFSLLTGGSLEAYTLACFLLVPYALFRWGSGREVAAGLALMLAGVGSSVLLGHLVVADAVGGFVVVFATLALGLAFRYRSRARTREFERVRLLERERLARDLHDTVAHHVSAMAIRAQAGIATAPARPEAAVEALRVIEAEASRTLTEMRALVRVLRKDEPAELEPGRGLADLQRLASRAGAGPAVDVEVSGDLDGLPPPVGAAVYRVAQEAVTNARRHARHATRIQVRVAADDSSVRLSVSDDGETGTARPAAAPGYGIIGMMERAGLLGGSCEAGPGPDRGWTVTAVLPRNGTAA